jgi:hypothetical protein
MVAQSERSQQFLGARLDCARRQASPRAHRQGDVLGDGEFRKQKVKLKNEP